MTRPEDLETLRFYSEFASTYVGSDAAHVSRHLSKFLETLSAGSKILELGCGGGDDARAMIEAGHLVDPTDGVAEIAQKAEELLGIPVKIMRFEQLTVLEVYDAVWANASLLHVPRSDLPAILTKVLAALKPGGLHHATYKRGGKEGRDRYGRYFNYLSSKEVVRMYELSGPWEILSVSEYIGGSYDPGVQEPWVAIMASKSG